MHEQRPSPEPMLLLDKIIIGMVLGLIAPFFIGGYIPGSFQELRLILLFGPIFGGSMAYFLDRRRRAEGVAGGFREFFIAACLAGGATAGVAFKLGYLTSVWHILLGFPLGGLVVVILWQKENS